METKHTPGPWRMESGDSGWFRIAAKVDGSLASEAILCSRSPWEHVAEQSIANGHLMTAAPEMLEALRSALATLEELNKHFYRDGEWTAVSMARAAIAKAEGR